MTERTWQQTRHRLIREFLALPHEALPSAAWVHDEDGYGFNAWDVLHGMNASLGYFPPELDTPDVRIRLRASHEGWRDGVIIGNTPPGKPAQ